mgnify:CR=1 FL=1
MQLLIIEKTNGKYLKNGKIISKKKLYEELSKYNIEQLEKNGFCKIRDKSEPKMNKEVKRNQVKQIGLKSEKSQPKTTKEKKLKIEKPTITKTEVKEKKVEKKIEVAKISKREQNKLERQQKKDEKILKSIIDDYKVKNHYYSYQDKHQIELYRYNRKGFYNFVTILENDEPETVNKAILDDFRKVQEQKPIKKEIDDDI